METGTVKFFNKDKGFGFIKVDGSNQELFVHKSECKDELHENASVIFEVKQDRKGPHAADVRLR